MAKFKQKLDDMMGDTSKQESRIKEQVRYQLMQAQPKPKRKWQVPVITAAATALAIFLFASAIGVNFNSADKGRGVPYDPLYDLVEISSLKNSGNLSNIPFEELLGLPTVKSLSERQYLDSQVFNYNGESYQLVVERQAKIYDEVSYKQGDIVRTMTNTGSHLPIYADDIYEVVAVPGDRVVLQDGKLTVNGKKVDSALLDKYEELGVTVAGGYDQLLNAREYLLLNHFPAQGSMQAATINAVHKIYGEVVAVARSNDVTSIFKTDKLNDADDFGPEGYFDLMLYDRAFRDGELARALTVDGGEFPFTAERSSSYFLEAGYRTVAIKSDNEAIIRYHYGRENSNTYEFTMRKLPNSNIWQWDN